MDWNWFFSSLAQSSAAIVGIFAAFVITKIINNQTEYSRKLARLRELNASSEYIRDNFGDRWFGLLNRRDVSTLVSEYEELLEENEDLEPEAALLKLDWPDYVSYERLIQKMKDGRESYFEQKKKDAARTSMERIIGLSSASAFPMPRDNTGAVKAVQERDTIDSLITELRQHIRVCELHKAAITDNPEASTLVTRSIIGAGLLFLFGVALPLSFLRVANGVNEMLEFRAWLVDLLTIKGALLAIVSSIFYAILGYFVLTNRRMTYAREEISTLERNLEFASYSEYLKIQVENTLKKRDLGIET